MIPVYNKIICQIRTTVQASGILLRASNEHSKLLEPFIAEQGSAAPGSEQHCLKSAQQEVTVRDQHCNLFAVSHTGEERQLHSSRPVSCNIFLDETTYLAFPMCFFFVVCGWH